MFSCKIIFLLNVRAQSANVIDLKKNNFNYVYTEFIGCSSFTNLTPYHHYDACLFPLIIYCYFAICACFASYVNLAQFCAILQDKLENLDFYVVRIANMYIAVITINTMSRDGVQHYSIGTMKEGTKVRRRCIKHT